MLIANHTSWLDILILGGSLEAAFVSKDELGHPFIHWLADQNATVYVKRTAPQGREGPGGGGRQGARRREAGHHLSRRVRPGRAPICFPSARHCSRPRTSRRATCAIRPVAIDYGRAQAEVGWFDEAGADNVKRILGRRGTLPVTVHVLAPLDPRRDRKQLTREARDAIAETLALNLARPLAYRRVKMNPKTFKIKSFGCQMNVYDGERMAELLAAQGMTRPPMATMPSWSS